MSTRIWHRILVDMFIVPGTVLWSEQDKKKRGNC